MGPLERLRNIYRDPGRRKKLYVFLVCLFLSAFFWLFIKLSREAQAVIERPLVVSQIPPDVVIGQQSHSRIQLTIQTTGARLLASRYFRSDDTLFVDAGSFGRTSRGGELWHFVTAAQMRSALSGQLDGGRSLTGIWPDTVFVNLAYASQKKVPVRLNANFSFERRFGQYGEVRLVPDSVMVRGPRQIVDTLQAISTESLLFENLSHTIEQKVELQNPAFGQGLTLETQQASLTLPVEEFTEISVELGLSVLCQHQSGEVHNLRLFPNRVTVTCLVALKDYNRVEPSLFVAHVICPNDGLPESNRLEVLVETFPDFVTIQNIRPATVEFLIME
ncbi:MAG: YbbR-like domain-containing protein [Bacteroidales bacterium]|nr:YbbR-like domain-containing protein [Bacteroidales bacterium]